MKKNILIGLVVIFCMITAGHAADWANPNKRQMSDSAGQLVLKHESNMDELFNAGTGKLNQLKANHSGSVAPNAPSTGQGWYDTGQKVYRVYDGGNWNSVDHGYVDSRSYSSLTIADAAATAAGKGLLVAINYSISSAVTITSPVKMVKGGSFTKSGSGTMAFNQTIEAGTDQIFIGFSAGDVAGLKKARPNWWGTNTTPGTSDMTTAIKSAIASLKIQKSGTRSDAFSAAWVVAGALNFEPGESYAISAPLLIENDTTTSPKTYYDNMVINGNGANIVALAGFAGVPRYYDTTHFETIKAMLLMGTKDFGKTAEDYQSNCKIRDLNFIGNGDVTLAGIYTEVGSDFTYDTLHFESMGYGIKARLLRHARITKITGYSVLSLIYSYNNTQAIKTDDSGSTWATGGSEGGNLSISDIWYMTPATFLVEAQKATGALHLFNTGEFKLSNITIFGGARGIVLDTDGASFGAVAGNQWSFGHNIEIAETELEAIYINKKARLNFSNLNMIWCVRNNTAWGSADYHVPIFSASSLRDSFFSNLVFDRSEDQPAKGGHDIQLTGSLGNIFSNINANGESGDTDATYSHISLSGSSYNQFSNLNYVDTGGGNKWNYAIEFAGGSSYNSGSQIASFFSSTANNTIGFTSGDYNRVTDIRSEHGVIDIIGHIVSTLSSTTSTAAVAGYDQVNFSNDSATNFTALTVNIMPVYQIKNITCRFYNSNTTLVHGAYLYLKGGANVTPAANQVMTFQIYNDGVNSYAIETGRNF